MAKAGLWRGILVYADGHSDLAEGFYPDGATWQSVDNTSGQTMQLPDNVFKADDENNGEWISSETEMLGSDILLTHTQGGDGLWTSESEINPYDITFTQLHD